MDAQEKNPLPSPVTASAAPPAMPAASCAPSLDAKGAARRRFTRLGAGSTGVILTLYSQPGMAASNAICATPSGFMSVTAASRSPQESCSYNRSHGYWKNHPEAWSSAGIDHNAKFGKVLPPIGPYAALAEVTLMDVLVRTPAVKDIDQSNLATQIVTALLNARSARYAGVPSVLPEERVMEIWNEVAAKGYYTPGVGASIWSSAQTVEYLESTFR